MLKISARAFKAALSDTEMNRIFESVDKLLNKLSRMCTVCRQNSFEFIPNLDLFALRFYIFPKN
jgi:hypothetical protein